MTVASDNAKTRNEDISSLISLSLLLSVGLAGIVVAGLLSLSRHSEIDAPRLEHIREVQDATCAKSGMVRREKTKYTPVVCAFRLDDEGNRIPFDN